MASLAAFVAAFQAAWQAAFLAAFQAFQAVFLAAFKTAFLAAQVSILTGLLTALLAASQAAFQAVNDAKRMGQKRFNTPTLDRFEEAHKESLRQGYRHHRSLELKHGPPIPPTHPWPTQAALRDKLTGRATRPPDRSAALHLGLRGAVHP